MSTTPSSKKVPSPSTLSQRQHSCQVTRAVQTMSSLHQTSLTNTARKYFYSRAHFPWILGGIMAMSGVAGYYCMGTWHDKQMEERKRIYVEAYHNGAGGDSTPSNNQLASSAVANRANLISSDARNGANEGGENSLVSLARKLTHRIVTPAHAQDSPSLQRQVTKFW